MVSFEKIFFFVGALLVLWALVGVKMQSSERAPTALTGLFIVLFTMKWIVPLSSVMQDITGFLGLIAICWVVGLQWRRRKSDGTAA